MLPLNVKNSLKQCCYEMEATARRELLTIEKKLKFLKYNV
jgi:hypothetical protein